MNGRLRGDARRPGRGVSRVRARSRAGRDRLRQRRRRHPEARRHLPGVSEPRPRHRGLRGAGVRPVAGRAPAQTRKQRRGVHGLGDAPAQRLRHARTRVRPGLPEGQPALVRTTTSPSSRNRNGTSGCTSSTTSPRLRRATGWRTSRPRAEAGVRLRKPPARHSRVTSPPQSVRSRPC